MFRLQRVAFLLLLPLGSSAFGAVYVPPGLNLGDTYHLVFVSSTTRDAMSSDIGVYNAHVQAAADEAGIGASEGVSWYAIASTPDIIDARDNARVTAPVYRMDGLLVATGFADLWDGSISSSISYNELTEEVTATSVWTGSWWYGTEKRGLSMDNNPISGCSWATDRSWIDDIEYFPPEEWPLYGLSSQLTVIPEPSSLAVWALLGAVAGGLGYAKRKRGQAHLLTSGCGTWPSAR